MKKLIACYGMLVLATSCFFCTAVFGQEVSVRVDRNRIGLDESIDLTVTLAGGDGVVDISPIADFSVLSRGASTRIQIVNGQSSRETEFNYTLFPRQTGNLTIPALPVRVGGTILTTQKISIHVSKTASTQSPRTDIFARAEVTKADPYQGEQIIYHLRLYHAVRIADPTVRELPDFSGFSTKQLKNRDSYRKIIDGSEFIVHELSFVLTPLSTGVKTIGPASISLDVYRDKKGQARGSGRRLFDDLFFNPGKRETMQVRCEPLTVNVRPLPPDESGSAPFSGLVGRFAIEAGFDRKKVQVGEAATLSVTLSGKGNVMDAAAPGIQVPEGLKAYADTPEEKIELSEQGFEGRKTFRTALVGVTPGDYRIEPVRVRYFDTASGAYRTLLADVGSITVQPSNESDTFKAASGGESNSTSATSKKAVEFTGRDILPVSADLDALKSQKPIGLPLFMLLLAAPGILCLGAWGTRRLGRPTNDPAAMMAKRARRELKAAENTTEERVLSHLSRALIAAVLSRGGVKGESLTYREAEEILVSTGLAPDLAREIGGLLDRIDSGCYGNAVPGPEERQALLCETRSCVAQVLKS